MHTVRSLVARVALDVAADDEVAIVRKLTMDGAVQPQDIENIRKLAELPVTASCMEDTALIEAADTNRMTDGAQEHLVACRRCARLGQYIAMMRIHAR